MRTDAFNKPDVISIGPDGTIIIVEFKARKAKGKQPQIDQYQQSVRNLITEINPQIDPRIIAFKASYDFSSKKNAVRFTSSKSLL